MIFVLKTIGLLIVWIVVLVVIALCDMAGRSRIETEGCAMTNDKKCEAMAIWWAVDRGKCDVCRYHDQCTTQSKFDFPADADCMKRKQELLEEE